MRQKQPGARQLETTAIDPCSFNARFRGLDRKLPRELKRSLAIDRQAVDEDARTVRVSFSSQLAVQDRFFGPPTVLLHESRAVDLSVLRNIGAALLNHDPSIDSIAGRIDSVEIDQDDRVGRAVIAFDDDDVGERAFQKVRSGSLRGVSVRFSVEKTQLVGEREEWKSPGGQKFEGGERGVEVATRWTPREISLTPTPADVSVGVGRGENPDKEQPPMEFSAETKARLTARGLEESFFSSEEAAIKALDKLDAEDAQRAFDELQGGDDPPADDPNSIRAEIERETFSRVREFNAYASRIGKPEKAAEWFTAGLTLDQVKDECLRELETRNPKPAGAPLERGVEQVEKTRIVLEGAMFNRAKMAWSRPEGFQESIPDYVRLEDVARACLNARGENVGLLRGAQLFSRALSHTAGDFANLLENIANKSMQQGFAEAPTTYQAWTVAGSIDDFKQAARPGLGEIQNFELTPDGSPFPEATISDKTEKLTLATYSRKFVIGRQAFINDDQRGFTRIPSMFGAAGARTINKAVYDHLTSASGVGPTMTEDSKALFATDHPSGANYITGAGTTLLDTQIAIGRRDMMKQLMITASQEKGAVSPSSARANIAPTFLLVPAALVHTADQIVNGVFTPTTEATARTQFITSLQVISEALLDDATNGATAWYLIASPAAIDTVEVARLAGQTGPEFQRMDIIDGLGFAWAGFVDFAVQALEHRGMFRSKGAA